MPIALSRHPLFAQAASYFTVVLLSSLVLIYGLIPGLLAVCLGYLLANAIARVGIRRVRLGPTGATVVVIAVPLLGLMALLLNARGMVFGAVVQYEAMLHHLAGTVLEIRQKLPGNLAIHLPDELLGAQIWLSEYLKSQAHAIADLGTSGLRGGLLVYVGLVIGALIEGAPAKRSDTGELRVEMRKRASHFIDAFRQIVVA